jgi:hypothetical protein
MTLSNTWSLEECSFKVLLSIVDIFLEEPRPSTKTGWPQLCAERNLNIFLMSNLQWHVYYQYNTYSFLSHVTASRGDVVIPDKT